MNSFVKRAYNGSSNFLCVAWRIDAELHEVAGVIVAISFLYL